MYEMPLALQTVYADLLDRAFNDAFAEDFPENGTFVSKKRNGRTYWYFQPNDLKGRPQKYVGPETPELLDRIENHKRSVSDVKQRRSIVAALHNSAGLPRPGDQVGSALEALAKAGVFRLRAVMVGTVAYQTYAAMLGVRLPARTVMSIDIDIAQFWDISIAVEDAIPSMLDVLQSADKTFRAIPHSHDSRQTTRYEAMGGLRVDFLTPNPGPDTDAPQHLEALNTDAEQLRFLDFLIVNPVRAVVLHGVGTPVLVPSPQRYAVHKLIVSRRRREENIAKIGKDLWQASALIQILAKQRLYDLKDAWEEAWDRGPVWRRCLGEGVGQLEPDIRDLLLKAIGADRSIVPDLTLSFPGGRARYDFGRDVVAFPGEAGGQRVICRVSREALDDDFGAEKEKGQRHMAAFKKHRNTIQAIAAKKFLYGPIEDLNVVLVKSGDVENRTYGPSGK
jgi:hypothetical protein